MRSHRSIIFIRTRRIARKYVHIDRDRLLVRSRETERKRNKEEKEEEREKKNKKGEKERKKERKRERERKGKKEEQRGEEKEREKERKRNKKGKRKKDREKEGRGEGGDELPRWKFASVNTARRNNRRARLIFTSPGDTSGGCCYRAGNRAI